MLGETKVQVTIISPKWQEIRKIVFDDINRGCTLLNVTTGYYQKNQFAVMSVVSKRELHQRQWYCYFKLFRIDYKR